jgi:hypothetical protein
MVESSAADPKFLSTLETWIRALRDMLVLFRYSAAAGNKDFEFFSSLGALSQRIGRLPPSTSIIAFRQPQLPLRGVVDNGFIANCLSSFSDGEEFLVLETKRRTYGERAWSHWVAGETCAELRQALEDSRGAAVAVGPYPPWLEDSGNVVAAIVPDKSGIVRVGVY